MADQPTLAGAPNATVSSACEVTCSATPVGADGICAGVTDAGDDACGSDSPIELCADTRT